MLKVEGFKITKPPKMNEPPLVVVARAIGRRDEDFMKRSGRDCKIYR